MKHFILKSGIPLIKCLLFFPLMSCSSDTSEFYYANLGTDVPKIVIASNSAGQYALSMYDTQGSLVRVLSEYVPANVAPRGLAKINELEFLVSFDGGSIDSIGRYNLIDGATPFVNDSSFSGNIFQIRHNDTHGTFAIKSNQIESFDDLGQRVSTPRIDTINGACVLNIPRGMTFNSSNNLVVVATGNDFVNVYDVSDPANTLCLTSNVVLGGLDPVAVVAHSDGHLYIVTQGDDSVYQMNGDGTGAATRIFNNTGFILDPTAIIELPDGTLLVASDGTDSLVNITTAGALVGSNYFLSDVFTNSVSDMILLEAP